MCNTYLVRILKTCCCSHITLMNHIFSLDSESAPSGTEAKKPSSKQPPGRSGHHNGHISFTAVPRGSTSRQRLTVVVPYFDDINLNVVGIGYFIYFSDKLQAAQNISLVGQRSCTSSKQDSQMNHAIRFLSTETKCSLSGVVLAAAPTTPCPKMRVQLYR